MPPQSIPARSPLAVIKNDPSVPGSPTSIPTRTPQLALSGAWRLEPGAWTLADNPADNPADNWPWGAWGLWSLRPGEPKAWGA